MSSNGDVESRARFSPQFDQNGLVTCVIVDVRDGAVLMVAHMNAASIERTIESGEVWFWSRSRNTFWRKGETSGNTLRVEEMFVDCDQDAILVKARVGGKGVACHTGRRSCFYRRIPVGRGKKGDELEFI